MFSTTEVVYVTSAFFLDISAKKNIENIPLVNCVKEIHVPRKRKDK